MFAPAFSLPEILKHISMRLQKSQTTHSHSHPIQCPTTKPHRPPQQNPTAHHFQNRGGPSQPIYAQDEQLSSESYEKAFTIALLYTPTIQSLEIVHQSLEIMHYRAGRVISRWLHAIQRSSQGMGDIKFCVTTIFTRCTRPSLRKLEPVDFYEHKHTPLDLPLCLSSQTTLSGKRCRVEAASHFNRILQSVAGIYYYMMETSLVGVFVPTVTVRIERRSRGMVGLWLR
jgi:hypothetical protein